MFGLHMLFGFILFVLSFLMIIIDDYRAKKLNKTDVLAFILAPIIAISAGYISWLIFW